MLSQREMLFVTRNIQILAPSLMTSFVSPSARDNVRKSLQNTSVFEFCRRLTGVAKALASFAEKVLSREEPGDSSKDTAK